jgi:hypothetical protein
MRWLKGHSTIQHWRVTENRKIASLTQSQFFLAFVAIYYSRFTIYYSTALATTGFTPSRLLSHASSDTWSKNT